MENRALITQIPEGDLRKEGLKNGLRQLTVEQLKRVRDYKNEMCLDTYNWKDGKFCPLSIAIGLDKELKDPSHEKVYNILINRGYKVYNTRGLKGTYYTTNRQHDLKKAVQEVIHEKSAL